MRVAAFVHFYVPYRNAGSETMLHAMLKRLQREGHEVLAFATENGEKSYEHDGIPVVSINWVLARQFIEVYQPELVITHHQNTARAAKLASKLNCRWAFLMHNDFDFTVGQLEFGPDLTVFNTDHFAAKYGHLVNDSVVVHPPVYAEQHRAQRGDCVTLVNLSENKGASRFYALAERFPDTRFLGVTGGHGEQVFRTDLPNVEIIPQTSDMRNDVWARTKVLLMPSVYESYGMAGVEAMASGIPVMAHPTPGLLESLSHAGVFIERSYQRGWEDTLCGLLAHPNTYQDASQAALQRSAELNPEKDLNAFVEAVGRSE